MRLDRITTAKRGIAASAFSTHTWQGSKSSRLHQSQDALSVYGPGIRDASCREEHKWRRQATKSLSALSTDDKSSPVAVTTWAGCSSRSLPTTLRKPMSTTPGSPSGRLAVRTNKPRVSLRSGPRVEVGWPRPGEDGHDQLGDLGVVRALGIAVLSPDVRLVSHRARPRYHGLSLIRAGWRLP